VAFSASSGPIPAAAQTLALCILLATVLGGLAGALSFASDNGRICKRLQAWLRSGGEVVLVNSERGHEDTLRMLGATEAGSLD
jgi:hypothetical protein